MVCLLNTFVHFGDHRQHTGIVGLTTFCTYQGPTRISRASLSRTQTHKIWQFWFCVKDNSREIAQNLFHSFVQQQSKLVGSH